MRPSGRPCQVIAAVAMLCVAGSSAFAVVLPIEIQVQSQYQILEVKPEGDPLESTSSFSTTYNLGLRRQLTPRTKLQSHLTVNSSDYSDQIGEQSSRNIVFNLISQERTYTLTGGVNRSDHRSARSALGTSSFSDGSTTNYNANFVWQESALPVVNLQYRKSTTDVSSGLNNSIYSTGTWLVGSYYEYSPLRFTFDRQAQANDFSGRTTSTHSETVRSRMGVNFEQELLDGLNLTADLSRDVNTTDNGTFGTRLNGTSSSVRLTATPTRSILLSADKSFYSSRFTGRLLEQDNDSETTSLSMRSEILPGLSFAINRFVNDQTSDLVKSNNKNLSATLGAALTRDTFATLGWSKSTFNTTPGDIFTKQQNSYISLRTPIGFDTDMNLDFGLTESVSGTQTSYDGKYASVHVRNRSKSDMSLGLGYRWNLLDLTGGTGGKLTTQSLDFDIAWTPASTLGINARANYYFTSGNTISEYLSPTVDIRWEPSSQSNLVLRYNFNRSNQWDPLLAEVLGQSAKGISARFSYRLSRRSSFDITYDYQASGSGGIDFQRAIRAYFRTRL